jgi:hypothetical protein
MEYFIFTFTNDSKGLKSAPSNRQVILQNVRKMCKMRHIIKK